MNTFIFIGINKKKYVVDPTSIREIIKIPKIVAVPNAGSEIIGIINYKGTPIPVFNISKEYKENVFTKIIVLKLLNENIGILIDGIYKIGDVKKEDLIDKFDYSLLLDEESIEKVSSAEGDVYFFKIIGSPESDMLFLRFMICVDVFKNSGKILSISVSEDDIENDSLPDNNLLIVFMAEDDTVIEDIHSEITKVSEIAKVDYFKIEEKKDFKLELENYLKKSQRDVTLFDIDQLEKILKERYKIEN